MTVERDRLGNVIMYCFDDVFGPIVTPKSLHKERFGRTFTKAEAKEHEKQFKLATLCGCGEPMSSYRKDLKIHGEYFGSQEFLRCEKCDISMIDCGVSNQYVKKLLDADIEPTEALGVFDQ
tara:strand:- start:56 stop:418 length:363 start_codon:yes stop_codon:yes gene_type:complete